MRSSDSEELPSAVTLETGFTPTVDFSKPHMMRDKRSSATPLMLRALHQSYRPKAPFEPSVPGGVTSWSLSACRDVSVAMPRCGLLRRVQGLRASAPPVAASHLLQRLTDATHTRADLSRC